MQSFSTKRAIFVEYLQCACQKTQKALLKNVNAVIDVEMQNLFYAVQIGSVKS